MLDERQISICNGRYQKAEFRGLGLISICNAIANCTLQRQLPFSGCSLRQIVDGEIPRISAAFRRLPSHAVRTSLM